MGDTPITNASTGVTPDQLGGSGPSTDLNPPGTTPTTPPGTTKVENGIAYDASGKALGSVKTPAASSAQPLDLSAGFVPKQTAPVSGGGIDLSAGFVSKPPEVLAKQAAWQKAGQQPISEVKQTTPSWAGVQMGISATPKPVSSGTSWDERHGVSPTQVADWARRAQEDVRHGTDQTWLGAVLKYMGAKGTEYGVSEKSSDIMGGPLLGTLRVAQAPGDISQGHPVKAINKIVGGSMQAAGPALMLAPEALPLYAPMTKASELAGAVAKEMGADEDTQEFVENAAGLWVAHKAHGMQSDTSFNNFNRSVEAHVEATKKLQQERDYLSKVQNSGINAALPEAKKAHADAFQEYTETKQTMAEAAAALEAESKLGPKTQAVVNTVKGAAKDIASQVKQAVTLGQAPTVREAVRRQAPATKAKAAEYRATLERSEPDLEAILQQDPRASEDPKGLHDAIQNRIDGITDDLLARSKATIDETKPVVPDIENRVRESMKEYARQHRGEMGSDAEVEAAQQKVMEQILRAQGGEGTEPPTSRAVNLHEAEGLRRKLNRDGQKQFNTNAQPTTDAYKVLSQHVATDVLRPAIDERFTADGVDGVKEARTRIADLIDVKDQVIKGQELAEKMGQPGVIKSVMKKLGTPGFIVSLLASGYAPHIGIPGLVAMVLGDRIAHNLTNPGVNAERAGVLARQAEPRAGVSIDTSRADQAGLPPTTPPAPTPPQPPVPQPPPTNHGLHAALASYYDVPVDSTDAGASLEALKQKFYKAGKDIAEGKIKPTPEQAQARAEMLKMVNEAVAEDRKIQAEQHQKAMDKYNAEQEKAAEKAQKEQEKAAEKAAKEAEKAAAEQQKKDEEKQKLLDERKLAEEKEQQKTADNVKKELADKEKEDLKAKENPEKEPKPKPAGRTNLIGKLTHVVHPDNPDTAADQRIQRTPARALFGHSDESALGHEWAHAAQAAVEGLGSGDISSHLHPDSQPNVEGGSPAFGGVERGKAPWIEDENAHDKHTREAIFENTKAHIRVNMAGAVANELLHGIPIEDNAGLHTDMAQSKQWLEAHGIEGADADALIQDAINQVREGFSKHPQILDAIKENSHVRERGLSPQLHASRERVAKFGDHIKDIIDANENNGRDGENNRGNKGKPDAGRQSGVREAGKETASEKDGGEVKSGRAAVAGVAEAGPQGGHAGGGVASEEELARPGRFVKVSRSGAPTDQGKTPDFNLRPGEAGYQVTKEGPKLVAGEESAQTKRGADAYHKEVFGKRVNLEGAQEEPELRVPFKEGRGIPPERTAGKHDAAIKAGGGVPGGIQEGDPEINLPDLALFHDPTTGSTLALKADQVTPENVKKQIQKSRQTYLAAKPEESRIPTKGQPGYDEAIHGNAGRSEIRGHMEPEEFKSWFGKSKITDAAGKPMTAYHGTTSPVDFDEFSTDGAPTDNEGNPIVGSSGDPNAYLGAHFAIGDNAANVASKFAVNKEGWMRSRYEGESPKPRVIPAYLKVENPAKFKSESGLNDFIYRTGKISDEELLQAAMHSDGIDPDVSDREVESWYEEYDNNPDFRQEQNEWILRQSLTSLGYGDSESNPLEDAAAELGQQAKAALIKKGHDGIIYKNDIEGGHAAVVFETGQISSAIQNRENAK